MNTMQYEAGVRTCGCDLGPRDGGCGFSSGVARNGGGGGLGCHFLGLFC